MVMVISSVCSWLLVLFVLMVIVGLLVLICSGYSCWLVIVVCGMWNRSVI